MNPSSHRSNNCYKKRCTQTCPTGPTGFVDFFIGSEQTRCNIPQVVLQPDLPNSNIDMVLVTPGSGRLTRVQSINNPVLEGNCRGLYATDFQSDRNASNQVAGG